MEASGKIPDFARIANRADIEDAELKKWTILLGNAVGTHVRPIIVAAYGLGCIMDAGRLQRMGGKAKDSERVASIGVASLQQALRMVGLESGPLKEGGADGSANERTDGAPAPGPVPEGGGDERPDDSQAAGGGTGDGALDVPQGEGELEPRADGAG